MIKTQCNTAFILLSITWLLYNSSIQANFIYKAEANCKVRKNIRIDRIRNSIDIVLLYLPEDGRIIEVQQRWGIELNPKAVICNKKQRSLTSAKI